MEQCKFTKCKDCVDFVYLGRHICSSHWEQLCDADSKTEKRLLKKINLIRDKSGAVVPITQE